MSCETIEEKRRKKGRKERKGREKGREEEKRGREKTNKRRKETERMLGREGGRKEWIIFIIM